MEHFLVRETWDWLSDEKRVRKGSYWLQACNGYRVRPGATAQYLHRYAPSPCSLAEALLKKDFAERYSDSINSDSVNLVGGFVAGTDVTARNGGTNIIPGSHLWPIDRIPRPEEAVAAQLKKGDGVFWLSTIFHGAGANVCQPGEPDAERMMYGYFGTIDTLRQPDLQILSVPPEVVLKMPEIVLRMVVS
ncbi:hypothetical protein A1O1_07842 [Capronia coronata CBS 617.96]|uniref:Phytanoyl-CoA dioxygenase n=1 Tax=Capronia coronata CBS 617.96 TaxID=1182541 RepID=W9XML1_9EURO|nr:uncharacterized protein A1O1_07842 [Capronia coronata CBS 617.96]EXJ81777.1 hypothetical protein A1O1_07842 [Capronia coronata CBS 617.96]